jgi:predicted nucleic acid-binding protein
MLVVSDATPLHYLILINEIDLLRQLYGRVVVPAAVVEELSVSKAPIEVRSWIVAMPEWVIASPSHPLVPLPFDFLGLGERQAIALARESSNSILLTDDLQARAAAESVGVQVVPTVRILATAAALSLVDFKDAIRRLRQTNFRVSQEIIDQILGLASDE